MRATVLVILALASTTARAERSPVITLAGMVDLRGVGDLMGQPSSGAGGRVTLSFEDHPLYPAMPGTTQGQLRLVPELFAGTLASTDLVEGYVGAGVRGEVALAATRLRPTLYLAARAIAIGRNVDGAAEFAFGNSYLLGGWTRLGWELAIDLRGANRDSARQLDALGTFYVGWKL